MAQSDQFPLQDLTSILENWKGEEVRITREEDGERIQAVLHLQDVETGERGSTIDDYVAKRFIRLTGPGTIITDEAGGPLPDERYEIPLDTVIDKTYDGVQLYLTTGRGFYILTGPAEC
ncbi:MAG: hypothetical protein H0Z33_01595 [Bacillaceae bacterium]|nr:hypothetical protein [Bacillaceae bacterium]